MFESFKCIAKLLLIVLLVVPCDILSRLLGQGIKAIRFLVNSCAVEKVKNSYNNMIDDAVNRMENKKL